MEDYRSCSGSQAVGIAWAPSPDCFLNLAPPFGLWATFQRERFPRRGLYRMRRPIAESVDLVLPRIIVAVIELGKLGGLLLVSHRDFFL